MNSFLLSLVFFIGACTHAQPKRPVPSMVHISEVAPDRETELTKQNFTHLIQIYDLAPFFYTYTIHIEKNVPPRSHPVLTLNTAYANQPGALLAQFLHEEFHWWANSRPHLVRRAILDLQKIFPKVTVVGQETTKLTYLHIIINSLEYQALTKYLGKREATQTLRLKMQKEDHYRWAYETVMLQSERIQAVIVKNNLLPKDLL